MNEFLDEDFRPEYLEWVASVRSEEYYVRMMAAWFFATALAKRYDESVVYIEERRLEPQTHRKAIQKAVESFRVPDGRKEYLKTLRQACRAPMTERKETQRFTPWFISKPFIRACRYSRS